MKHLISIFFIVYFMHSTNAQKKWNIYAELLGSGEIYSLNGNYKFTNKKNIGIRTGVMYIKDFDPTIRTIHHLNYIIGSHHSIEFGLGISTNFRFRPSLLKRNIVPSGLIMYQFQGKNGFIIRGGITPTLINLNHENNKFKIKPLQYLYPGIGFGYSLGK